MTRVKDLRTDDEVARSECVSCGEGMPLAECSASRRACGHHCNHSWYHDECHWCLEVFGCDEDAGLS